MTNPQAAALVVALIVAAAVAAPVGGKVGRYQLATLPGVALRLDTRTGDVVPCRFGGGPREPVVCASAP